MPDADPIAPLATNLAENLRHLRGKRRFTQADVARLSGLPRSTVAQIETGMGNPTLAVLSRLAMSFRVSIEELLSPPRARCHLYKKGTLPTESRGRGATVIVHKLLPDRIPGMEIDRLELHPGARMTGVPHRPGTREYLACERGRIVLWTVGERFELAAGDVCAFEGDQRHSYANEGDSLAIGFSVVTLAPLPV